MHCDRVVIEEKYWTKTQNEDQPLEKCVALNKWDDEKKQERDAN